MVRLLATWLVKQDNIQVCATATVRTPITCDAVIQPLYQKKRVIKTITSLFFFSVVLHFTGF